ncbi:TnsA-like heteromeric transposase endonuclease subunit [Streptacidiphilus sp. EB129]|uniref:TnsA-like heteromeric transposase endonuclease subunit n=1 Tax=Streptacidiphilus sp. EB129 TaxID=3156262 RepID=UPI003516DEFA
MSRVLGSVSVSLRRPDGSIDDKRAWPRAGVDVFQPSIPWRTFRWCYGQKHYSGTYWSSTMQAHVVYESRLELTRLLYADFDPVQVGLFAQPFLLCAEVDGRTRRHVPDFLVLREDQVPMVVDVKPRHLLADPEVSSALGWAREAVESRGWDFQVWCEPPEAELANLRFLAGYRRGWLFDSGLLAELRSLRLVGLSLGEAFRILPHRPGPLVRAAVLHLLWRQEIATDLGVVLSARHTLTAGPAVVVGAGSRELPVPAAADALEEDEAAWEVPRSADGGRRSARGGHVTGAAVRVGVGTRLSYDGEVVTVEEMFGASTGNEVLVRDGRDRRFRLSLREVLSSGRARVIPEYPGPASDDAGETASVLLAQLGSEELAEIQERSAQINEVLYGYRSGSPELAAPSEPRPAYAPGTPLMRRYQAKAAELGVNVRTVRRWAHASLAEREAGLAREHVVGAADSGGVGRADPRWVAMALEIMAEHEEESTPTRAKVIRSIGPRLAARFPGEQVKLPSRPTAYRWLEELENRRPTFRLSAKRNRDIAARSGTAHGKLRPTRPGEYLLMDTTRLDVFALDPLTLRWVQPELTVAMDWYTRCITGVRLTPVSTKSIDVAATLFQAYRPRRAESTWPSGAVWPDHGVPRGILVDRDAVAGPMAQAAEGQVGLAGPALVPETIVVDHGKVYVSEHITSVCQRLGITISPARLRTGRDKGPIERFFRSLREGLLENLPGYKGPDVKSRGLSPESDAFFLLQELERIICEWVAVVYHRRPHRGLVDPRIPGLALSPAAMFDHGVARAGYIEVPRDPDLGFEFLKTHWTKIHHYGIEVRGGGRRYDGPGLDDFRGKTSPYTAAKAKGKWPVQFDPDDVNLVYFRHLRTRRWHTLTWEHAAAVRFPISEEALELARAMAKKKYRYPNDEDAVAELLERWNLGLGLTMAERRIALRQARDQSAFDLAAPEEGEEVQELPSVARVLALDAAEGGREAEEPTDAEHYEGPVAGDDDLDEELDSPESDEDFYASALEDA